MNFVNKELFCECGNVAMFEVPDNCEITEWKCLKCGRINQAGED